MTAPQGMKRWRKCRLFLIPEQHEPGKQPGFMNGKKRKKSASSDAGKKSR